MLITGDYEGAERSLMFLLVFVLCVCASFSLGSFCTSHEEEYGNATIDNMVNNSITRLTSTTLCATF